MKRAIVIGATSGIGRGLAECFAAQGYAVGLVGRRENLLKEIFDRVQEHPEQMSREYRNLIGCGEDKTQVVCDYIAGMTDQYSMHKYEELFVPKAWAVY